MTSKQETTLDHEVIPLPGIHDEALRLLIEAHNYFHQWGAKEYIKMEARGRMMYASEMSRITMRLSCIMAWLLARRAENTDMNTQTEKSAHYRLECRDVCMNQHIEAETTLPSKMGDLLEKTLELYQRVARLDQAMEN